MKDNTKKDRFGIIEYDQADPLRWDRFVFENRYGFVYYRYEYLRVDQEESTINKSFAVIDHAANTILALCPLFFRIVDEKITDVYCRNGILVKDDLGNNLRSKLANFTITYLNSCLEESGNKTLEAEIPALAILDHDHLRVNPLIHFGFKPGIRYTWITCIRDDPEILMSKFEPSTRADIRKLDQGNEFCFEEILDADKTQKDRFGDLLSLCKETYSRNHASARSDDYYRNIYYNLDEDYRRIFFLRNKEDDKAVAAAVFFIYRNKAHYDIGASITHKVRGTGKLLIYKSFLKLRDSGIDYVEMGGAYPYLPVSNKKRGISDFKKSFGCTLYPMLLGEFMSQV